MPGYFDAEPDLPPGVINYTQNVHYRHRTGASTRLGVLLSMIGAGEDPRQDLRSPYLLADNSGFGEAPGQIRFDTSWQVDLPYFRPENAPAGRSELTPWMPIIRQNDPVDQVTVPGVRPERPAPPPEPSSGPSPSRGMPSAMPPGRPQPSQRWEPFEQTWKRPRETAPATPPGWLIQPGVAAPFVQTRPSDGEPRPEGEPRPREERDFWSRGGTGLVGGAVAVGAGFLLLSNPVGWLALGGALMLAGGVAASSASSVELWASYGGKTTAGQDEAMNQAVAATLGYTGGGLWSVAGATVGTVVANDPRQGFESGAVLGGLPEGVMALPGAVRAVPRLWNAAVPWGQALLMAPGMMFLSAGGAGGTSVRSMARVLAAQRRAASGIRSVQIVGTTPVLQREAAWARQQVAATGSARETIFLVTHGNGEQQIVAADHFLRRAKIILEAKHGNMGQMYNLEHEARIMLQARTYLDMSSHMGARVQYLISTESGAIRLGQRFTLEFPAEVASGQLGVIWKPFKPK
ncbi:hypothetical protein RQ832_05330 [Roseomonas sp. DSM 102946]|nr:hypothetical protein [Roseomonas sp. DSM 102946]